MCCESKQNRRFRQPGDWEAPAAAGTADHYGAAGQRAVQHGRPNLYRPHPRGGEDRADRRLPELNYDHLRLCRPHGHGRRDSRFHSAGQRTAGYCRTDFGQLRHRLRRGGPGVDCGISVLQPAAAPGLWRQRRDDCLCCAVYEDLCSGYGVCRAGPGTQCLYYRPGLCLGGHDQRADRRGGQYDFGRRIDPGF